MGNNSFIKFLIVSLLMFALGSVATLGAQSKVPMSKGFDDLLIGMDFESLSTALQKHSGFSYKGLPEVSLSPNGEEKIIETRGGRFIKRGIFQFLDNKLFSIIIDFNEAELDYYTLFTSFSAKYGDPLELDPRQARWEDAEVRILLEKPLSIKYLSVPVIAAKQAAGVVQKTQKEETRESFINKL